MYVYYKVIKFRSTIYKAHLFIIFSAVFQLRSIMHGLIESPFSDEHNYNWIFVWL